MAFPPTVIFHWNSICVTYEKVHNTFQIQQNKYTTQRPCFEKISQRTSELLTIRVYNEYTMVHVA